MRELFKLSQKHEEILMDLHENKILGQPNKKSPSSKPLRDLLKAAFITMDIKENGNSFISTYAITSKGIQLLHDINSKTKKP